MTKPRPKAHLGMRHIALNVIDIAACTRFYVDLLGLKVIWQPDDQNIYLTSGSDNLALHLAPTDANFKNPQHLDHLGFFLSTPHEVDEWHTFLVEQGVTIKAEPKNHRDGTRSFYCADPDGNVVQMIYYPLD